MIESGLAFNAACLPTPQYLISHSSIRPAVDSVRRLLTSTHSSLKLYDSLNGRPSYEYSSTQLPKLSQGAERGSNGLSQDFRKVSDVESNEVYWASQE